MRPVAIIVALLISLLAASCLPETSAPQSSATPYTQIDFTVGVSEKHTVVIDLEAGQTIEGDFSISGQQDYIDFYIKDPSDDLLYDDVRAVGSHEFTAKAKYSGAHTLYFDNSFSFGTSRQIALRYRVR